MEPLRSPPGRAPAFPGTQGKEEPGSSQPSCAREECCARSCPFPRVPEGAGSPCAGTLHFILQSTGGFWGLLLVGFSKYDFFFEEKKLLEFKLFFFFFLVQSCLQKKVLLHYFLKILDLRGKEGAECYSTLLYIRPYNFPLCYITYLRDFSRCC